MAKPFSVSESDVRLLEGLIDRLPVERSHQCYLLDRVLDDALDRIPSLSQGERAELETLARSVLPGLTLELEVLDRLLDTLLEYEA
ncbi:hypothetical protein MOQ21_10635 [Stenotrophomonas maltophilia]|uniref:hypothetical protein n=1 Tax=Stenotrophomonas geniculata TaxID=86188 RepID=UPI001F483E08|nr:hypothetical protein [Stenotrophomonas geniculata]MCF3475926.1 hypothetical protein [Stenotrophomonas maltophilia]MCF3502442.1 hypothetical protein [Stenotrophomonas maltophilia]MCI1091768.1 hypothetical protein [Stenotrophomonas maltophilia]MCI1128276.1 hypothetical protein [Stenotrophomonas maltophilia]MDC7801707.1 hypothetical protein [Stenotrophomonas geniculata]